MKATMGPAISVLMKQTCIVALVLGEAFAKLGLLQRFI